MARGLELGPDGHPVLVEVDEHGEVVNEIGEQVGAFEYAFVLSGVVYQIQADAYDAVKNNANARGAVVVSTVPVNGGQSEYESYCNGLPTITVPALTASDSTSQEKIPCPTITDTNVRSMLLQSLQTILSLVGLGPDGPILLHSAINLREIDTTAGDKKSLLLSRSGEVLRSSDNPITFKWQYFQEGEIERPGIGEFNETLNERVLAPIPGAKIQQTPFMGLNQYVQTGEYSIQYHTIPISG